jgi:hypothetical protein
MIMVGSTGPAPHEDEDGDDYREAKRAEQGDPRALLLHAAGQLEREADALFLCASIDGERWAPIMEACDRTARLEHDDMQLTAAALYALADIIDEGLGLSRHPADGTSMCMCCGPGRRCFQCRAIEAVEKARAERRATLPT